MILPTTTDALLVVAAFSRHVAALGWGRSRLLEAFGPIGLESESFEFRHTSYYERSMGPGLRKQFFVFRDLAPLDRLADFKRQTIQMEELLARSGEYPEARPLNLDPGLLNLGKFMLATTKDKDHRIYLHDGIFAEVTLRYCDGRYLPWPWTYADYAEPAVREFLNEARSYYKKRLQEEEQTRRDRDGRIE